MTNFPGTDRETLTQKEYASDASLTARQQTHERYSVPKINFAEWVLDRVKWRGDEQVLDMGMGSGVYFEALQARVPRGRCFAGDLSLGMARKATQHKLAGRIGIFNGDAQMLPFSDNQFDVIMANHMLFHVPDIDRALNEFHRVLKPNGQLIASTNSQYNMPEFEQLIWRAYGLLGAAGPSIEPMRAAAWRFQLEDAPARLRRHFYAVVRYDLPGALVFPTVQPAMDYINSTRAIREPQLPHRVNWDDFVAVLTEQMQRLINHFGELIVNKLSGALVATDSGGFITDYVSRLDHKVEDDDDPTVPIILP